MPCALFPVLPFVLWGWSIFENFQLSCVFWTTQTLFIINRIRINFHKVVVKEIGLIY